MMDSTQDKQTPSGIQENELGERVVPESLRADGSVRPERRVRPGFVPEEDVPRYNVAERIRARRERMEKETAEREEREARERIEREAKEKEAREKALAEEARRAEEMIQSVDVNLISKTGPSWFDDDDDDDLDSALDKLGGLKLAPKKPESCDKKSAESKLTETKPTDSRSTKGRFAAQPRPNERKYEPAKPVANAWFTRKIDHGADSKPTKKPDLHLESKQKGRPDLRTDSRQDPRTESRSSRRADRRDSRPNMKEERRGNDTRLDQRGPKGSLNPDREREGRPETARGRVPESAPPQRALSSEKVEVRGPRSVSLAGIKPEGPETANGISSLAASKWASENSDGPDADRDDNDTSTSTTGGPKKHSRGRRSRRSRRGQGGGHNDEFHANGTNGAANGNLSEAMTGTGDKKHTN
ncbi:uncharacterized protein V1510DRAFT_418097 [Dipodascopsis tothii]|uniref:uncharacterized protein n=1 Tax=Dipodascopsis tothii TaxID=44089 RepID=UPI0034CED3EB